MDTNRVSSQRGNLPRDVVPEVQPTERSSPRADIASILPSSPSASTQLRHGGDIKGLVTDRSLDYLELMGVKVIYISGTPFLNMPWQADGYSALDFTLLDPHWGTVQDWADSIQKIHDRGM